MRVILIHDEMLNEALPVFLANPTLPRLFVFDPVFIADEGWALKRVQFVADCVAEIESVRVFHGRLAAVCEMLGVTSVVTQATPNTRIHRWICGAGPQINWHAAPPFANFDGPLPRFTPYWHTIAATWFGTTSDTKTARKPHQR